MPADHNLRPAATIPDDVLDDLVWMMNHRAAVVTMTKETLRILLTAYGRAQETSAAGTEDA